VRRDVPSPAREKKPSWGSCLAGLGQGSVVARPLDGGVLTRWGARVSARGPATAPWLSLARSSHSVAAVCAEVERGESGDEEREAEKAEWPLGFGDRGRGRFCSPEDAAQPSDRLQRRQMLGPAMRPRRARAVDQLCRPRPRLRPGCGRASREGSGPSRFCRFLGRFALLWAEMAEHSEIEFILFFPETDLIHI